MNQSSVAGRLYINIAEHKRHFLPYSSADQISFPVQYDPSCMDCIYWCSYLVQHPSRFMDKFVDDARGFLHQLGLSAVNESISRVNEKTPGIVHKARAFRAGEL